MPLKSNGTLTTTRFTYPQHPSANLLPLSCGLSDIEDFSNNKILIIKTYFIFLYYPQGVGYKEDCLCHEQLSLQISDLRTKVRNANIYFLKQCKLQVVKI